MAIPSNLASAVTGGTPTLTIASPGFGFAGASGISSDLVGKLNTQMLQVIVMYYS